MDWGSAGAITEALGAACKEENEETMHIPGFSQRSHVMERSPLVQSETLCGGRLGIRLVLESRPWGEVRGRAVYIRRHRVRKSFVIGRFLFLWIVLVSIHVH